MLEYIKNWRRLFISIKIDRESIDFENVGGGSRSHCYIDGEPCEGGMCDKYTIRNPDTHKSTRTVTFLVDCKRDESLYIQAVYNLETNETYYIGTDNPDALREGRS